MILPVLFLASFMPGQRAQSIDCANFLDRRTEFHSNADGLSIALRVHAADDHSKESHLCQTDYYLVITRRDGTSTERQMESIDDSWGRSVEFWIDGFALQGHRLVATIVERGEHPTFQIVAYNVPSKNSEAYEIPQSFIEQIPSSCQESLRAIGMTRLGEPVVGFRNGTCDSSTAVWKLTQGRLLNGIQSPSRPIRLPDGSAIEPIEPEESSAAQ